MNKRQLFTANRAAKRVSHTLALLFIVNYSLLIVNCPNPLITSVVYGWNVTFVDNDSITTLPVYKGYPIRRPSDRERWGYKLDAWYVDSMFEQMWNFNLIPQSDTTLYAKWLVNINAIIGIGGQAIAGNKVAVRHGGEIAFACALFERDGFADHIWSINGIEVGWGEAYVFDTTEDNKEAGKSYALSLTVMEINGGRNYSSSVTVTIN